MSKYGIGQPVLRFEDPRLLRGQGRYINDVNLPGQTHAVFVRSPHAHANIRSIDVAGAKKAPGVVAVYTGHDVAADSLGMPKANMPRKRPDGRPMFAPQRPPLVTDRVRYVGDPVVMVIAETLAGAKGVTRTFVNPVIPVARSLAVINGIEAPVVLKRVAPNVCVPASAAVKV